MPKTRPDPDQLPKRCWLPLLAFVIGAWAFVVAMPTASASGTETLNLVIENGAVKGGDTRRVMEGNTIRLVWLSDRKDELHLHGYDVLTLLKPGEKVEMAFEAHTAGRFPIELHSAHQTILYLEVYPK